MKSYEVLTPVQMKPGKPSVPAGETIELADDDARDLLKVRAIRLLPGAAKSAVEGDKPLGELTKPQLEAVAAQEQVNLDGAKNNAERVLRIEAVRRAHALPEDSRSFQSFSKGELEALVAGRNLTIAEGLDEAAHLAALETAFYA